MQGGSDDRQGYGRDEPDLRRGTDAGRRRNRAEASAVAEQMNGCQIGKRYVNADQSLEVLCIKPGQAPWRRTGSRWWSSRPKNCPRPTNSPTGAGHEYRDVAADGRRGRGGPVCPHQRRPALFRRDLYAAASGAARVIRTSGCGFVSVLDVSSAATPVALFGAALAGVPYAPLNYRLPADQVEALIARLEPLYLIADDDKCAAHGGAPGVGAARAREQFLTEAFAHQDPEAPGRTIRVSRFSFSPAAPPGRRKPPSCATNT